MTETKKNKDFARNDAAIEWEYAPELPIGSIVLSMLNPREDFNKGSLEELAESIKRHGLIQPIAVRELDGCHEIVCGERRFKAAKLAGFATIPASGPPQ